MAEVIPLFPLGTVLFPQGLLKLRIFEPRYVDMVGHCMREGSGFGIALIVTGREVGGPARTTEIGTLARIVDFERLEGGLLGITVRGERRFRIVSIQHRGDGLNVAEVQWLAAEATLAVPEERAILSELARQAFAALGSVPDATEASYEDATWVGMRLAEILPLPMPDRQRCLEMTDAIERLDFLRERLDIRF